MKPGAAFSLLTGSYVVGCVSVILFLLFFFQEKEG
jgi:hypothetical protein